MRWLPFGPSFCKWALAPRRVASRLRSRSPFRRGGRSESSPMPTSTIVPPYPARPSRRPRPASRAGQRRSRAEASARSRRPVRPSEPFGADLDAAEIVDEDVDTSVPLERLPDEPVRNRRARRGRRQPRSTPSSSRRRSIVRALATHQRPLGRKRPHDGKSDSLATAGDDRDVSRTSPFGSSSRP